MPVLSEFGHDISGLEALLLTAPNLLAADAGCRFYATDTGQYWICTGSGLWAPLGIPGLSIPGAVASSRSIKKQLTALVDNTATNLFLVTIPNAIMGGMLRLNCIGTLGDGDSSEASLTNIAFSRVAGANAKMVISTKSVTAVITGAAGNAAVTISNTAVSGAVGAVNTFQIQAKIARSAGSAAAHTLTVDAQLFNQFASGITFA